jgi:hypothetical protein
MKKAWITPEVSRFGSVAQMTASSEQPNSGKCPGAGDDAECGPSGLVGGCDPMGCPQDGVLS